MEEELLDRLVDAATEASTHSYSPYSEFSVGAAVLTSSGKIYSGANIENSSYGATMCAERVAVFKAISEGENRIEAIAIYTNAASLAFPCGMCLQVLSEFAEDIPVVLAGDCGMREYRLSELLPHRFGEE